MDLVYYPDVSKHVKEIGSAIIKFYHDHIKKALPFEHCIVDFHAVYDSISMEVNVQVVEVNPFGPTVGESLFDWGSERQLLQAGQDVWGDLPPEHVQISLHQRQMNAADLNTMVYVDDGESYGRWTCRECSFEDTHGARSICPRCTNDPWYFDFKGADMKQVACHGVPVRVLDAKPQMVTEEYLPAIFPVCRRFKAEQVLTRSETPNTSTSASGLASSIVRTRCTIA
jgi:hypothetical protein